ncbi:MAG: hypothetical protein M0Z41_09760 [Peptococcaceae bacterium]|nr:hypothetical protein [Peptococcaceae bacterium]
MEHEVRVLVPAIWIPAPMTITVQNVFTQVPETSLLALLVFLALDTRCFDGLAIELCHLDHHFRNYTAVCRSCTVAPQFNLHAPPGRSGRRKGERQNQGKERDFLYRKSILPYEDFPIIHRFGLHSPGICRIRQ